MMAYYRILSYSTLFVLIMYNIYQWKLHNPNNVVLQQIRTIMYCSASYGNIHKSNAYYTSDVQPDHTAFQPAHIRYRGSAVVPHHYLTIKPSFSGLGDQLQQYLHSVVLADKYNITFLTSQLPNNRLTCWDNYFNLHRDEINLMDLSISHVSNLLHHHTYIDANFGGMVEAEEKLVEIINQCNRKQQQCLITLSRINLPVTFEQVICQPYIIKQFRKKYCIQRASYPTDISLFTDYTIPNTIPVVVHYRAGDIATDDVCYRRQSFNSVVNTISAVYDIMHSIGHNITCHIFSETPYYEEFDTNTENYNTNFHNFLTTDNIPQNITINTYFDPLLKHQLLVERNIYTVLHLDSPAELTFHAMSTAPVFIASGSGYSTMANLLRSGLSLGVRPTCSPHFTLVDRKGRFNLEQFKQQLTSWTQYNNIFQWQYYNSVDKCHEISEWPQLDTYQPYTTYREQGIFNRRIDCSLQLT